MKGHHQKQADHPRPGVPVRSHAGWIREGSGGVLLRLHVQPRASRSEISGEYGDGNAARLKVRIAAPPVEGAANEEVRSFLSRVAGIPRSRITIVRGATSQAKEVLLLGLSLTEVLRVVRGTFPRDKT